MLRLRDTVNPLDELTPVVSAEEVASLVAWARAVHVAPAIEDYAVALATSSAETTGVSSSSGLTVSRWRSMRASDRGSG